jgi:hypothetical protein
MALVELERFSNVMAAEIVRGRLCADGIDAYCFDGGMNIADSAALAIPVRVMVDEDDLALAREALRVARAG